MPNETWSVHFPREPNNRMLEPWSYEYVKLYAAKCKECGHEVADPSRKEMTRLIRWHVDVKHGRTSCNEPMESLGLDRGRPMF